MTDRISKTTLSHELLTKVIESTSPMTAEEKAQIAATLGLHMCACGCETICRGHWFPGHDSRFNARLLQAERDRLQKQEQAGYFNLHPMNQAMVDAGVVYNRALSILYFAANRSRF